MSPLQASDALDYQAVAGDLDHLARPLIDDPLDAILHASAAAGERADLVLVVPEAARDSTAVRT
jgi:hypothetical protein